MHRGLFVALIFSLVALPFSSACSGPHGQRSRGVPSDRFNGSISIKGSDTLVILAQLWAEDYMREHHDMVVQVSGGGSGTGIAALLNGTTDVATSSRAMHDDEREHIAQARGGAPIEYEVAIDALAIYVHESNRVPSLSQEEIASIFRGQSEHWVAFDSEARARLGIRPDNIVLYSRENNSGTYMYFKEHVLNRLDFAASAQTLPGTAAVINAVAHDAASIGYGGFGYAHGVRLVPVRTESGEVVSPNREDAMSGRYPLARKLYIYTSHDASSITRAFLDYVLSSKGQDLVERAGFFPLAARTPS